MRSRRNLSLSESESESATKRRRAPVLGRFAGRAEAAEGVAGRFAGDAADETGASDGPRVAGFRSRGDAARRVWGVGDAARTTGVGLGACTTGVGLGARTGWECGPGASSPPPACKVPFVGCTDGIPLPPRASSFCWHVSRILVAFFSCSTHALRGQRQRAKSSCGKGPTGVGERRACGGAAPAPGTFHDSLPPPRGSSRSRLSPARTNGVRRAGRPHAPSPCTWRLAPPHTDGRGRRTLSFLADGGRAPRPRFSCSRPGQRHCPVLGCVLNGKDEVTKKIGKFVLEYIPRTQSMRKRDAPCRARTRGGAAPRTSIRCDTAAAWARLISRGQTDPLGGGPAALAPRWAPGRRFRRQDSGRCVRRRGASHGHSRATVGCPVVLTHV